MILAGGRSTRMGRDKAWIPVGGVPLVVRQAERLAGAFTDVAVAAKEAKAFEDAGLRVVLDRDEGFAPIFGIRAALRELGRPVFVLAVDLPRFPAALAAAIARDLVTGRLPCVAPVAEGRIQVLSAAYDLAVRPAIDRAIETRRFAIRDVVAECGALRNEDFWGGYGGPEMFENWNRPEDHEPGDDA